jgi:hypothetical protein
VTRWLAAVSMSVMFAQPPGGAGMMSSGSS